MAIRERVKGTIWYDGKRERFRVKFPIGKDPHTGKTKHKVKDCKTRNEAIKVRKEMEEIFDSKSYIKDITAYSKVRDVAEYWVDKVAPLSARERVLINYRGHVDNHIIPMFGDFELKELTPTLIKMKYREHFYGEYSKETMKTVARRFSSILKYAVEQGALKETPHKDLNLSQLIINPKKKKTQRIYSDEELNKILKICYKKIKVYGIYIFLAGTGCRIGEASALTWDCIDYENRTIEFNKQVVAPHGKATVVYHLKNRNEDDEPRIIPMNDELENLLKKMEEALDKEANDLNLVFPSTNYSLKNPNNSRKTFENTICIKNNIEYKTLHALRHTFATKLMEAKENIVKIAKILGHKDTSTTLNKYGHARDNEDDDPMNTASNFIKME